MRSPFSRWRTANFAEQPFLVWAMFTPGYRDKAERLAASLDAFAIGHSLYEVSTVHRSINPNGSDQIETSKPRFISQMLAEQPRPVLYLDADVVVRARPELIAQLCKGGTDFAAYNWLNDRQNDAWHPHPQLQHLWKFFFTVNIASVTQLLTSGAVQLWNQGPRARQLLVDWESMLLRFPRAQDDQLLDMAFNQRPVNAAWLPKAYARYAFWPFEKPILDHPDFPQQNSELFQDLGMARFNQAELSTYSNDNPCIPRDVILDLKSRIMVFPDGSTRPLSASIYL